MLKLMVCLNLQLVNLIGPSACDTKPNVTSDTSTIQTNPYYFIANELEKDKIVMVGERWHDNPMHFNSVIAILKHWVELAEGPSISKKKLVLILEEDSIEAFLVNGFVKTGVWDSTFTQLLLSMSYEILEFYSKLHRISLGIDSLNQVKGTRIRFEIKGFEDGKGLDFKDTAYWKMSCIQDAKWFVNERDLHTSQRIIHFINKDTSSAVLISYGGVHMQDGLVNKHSIVTELNENECYGYFLGYYLKTEYGSNHFKTFFFDVLDSQSLQHYFPDKYSGGPLLVTSDSLPLSMIGKYNSEFVLFLPGYMLYPHMFGFVFSKYVVEQLSHNIETLENFLPGCPAKKTLNLEFRNIYFITGKKLDNVQAFRKWSKENKHYDGFGWLTTEEFRSLVFENYQKAVNDNAAKFVLQVLGLTDEDFGIRVLSDSIWRLALWPSILPKIEFINSIGIYWIGSPEEKEMAKKYLIQYSRQDYSEPEKYLQWYRKNILSVDY